MDQSQADWLGLVGRRYNVGVAGEFHGSDGVPQLFLDGGAGRRDDHVVPDGPGATGGGAVRVQIVHGGGVLVELAHFLQAVELPRLNQQAAVPVLPRNQLHVRTYIDAKEISETQIASYVKKTIKSMQRSL
jgi:hypothetical protein